MNDLLRFRIFIGTLSLTVICLSGSFAYKLSRKPAQESELDLLILILCEVLVALSIASLLGFIWAVFAPQWVGKIFRLVWHHFKYVLYVFYATLAAVGIYAVFLSIFKR